MTDKELQLEEIFYMIQLAVQSAIGEDREFDSEIEQNLDNVYHKLKYVLGIE